MELLLIARSAAVLGTAKGAAIVHGVLSCYPALGHVGHVVRRGKGSVLLNVGRLKLLLRKQQLMLLGKLVKQNML